MSEVTGTEISTEETQVNFSQAGDLLRAAREAQGIHIAVMAVTLKVPVKKLEALEAGRYNELPDVVFVRSLAMSVCRALKINPDEVLAALPQLTVHSIQPHTNVTKTEFKSHPSSPLASLLALFGSPLGLGAVALMLATLVLLFWRDISTTADTVTDTALTSSVTQAPTPPLSVLPDSVLQALPAETQASAAVDATALLESSAISNASLADSRPGNETFVAPTDTTQQALLAFNARGVSWIEVRDADGAPRLRKLTADGDRLRVSGKSPLSVIVGRVDVIEVTVRGQALDLAPLARENVARFEVK